MNESNQASFTDLDADLDAEVVIAEKPKKDFLTAQADFANRSIAMVDCPKCNGSGKWVGGFVNYVVRKCFSCDGSGKVKSTYKPLTRQQTMQRRATRMANEQKRMEQDHERFQAWAAANPVEHDWLTRAAERHNEFAIGLLSKVRQYGDLTDNQRTAVLNAVAKADDARIQRSASAPDVGGEGLNKLMSAFATAKIKGLKNPKIRIDPVRFTLASESSNNRGHLYVKSQNGEYLGKITPEGKFMAARDCPADMQQTVAAVCKNPLEHAIAHGRRTGNCAICGKLLTKGESIDRGIGPICAEKFGW